MALGERASLEKMVKTPAMLVARGKIVKTPAIVEEKAENLGAETRVAPSVSGERWETPVGASRVWRKYRKTPTWYLQRGETGEPQHWSGESRKKLQ